MTRPPAPQRRATRSASSDQSGRSPRRAGVSATQSGGRDHRSRLWRGGGGDQHVQPFHSAVAAGSGLLGVAIGLNDSVVNVHPHHPLRADQDGRLPGQPRQQPSGDRVELTNMPEGEGAQENAQRRRRPDTAEQPAHAAMPQQVHVADRICAGDHASNQRRREEERADALFRLRATTKKAASGAMREQAQ